MIELEFGEFLKSIAETEHIVVYTDGACSGNPGPGGYGAIFISGSKRSSLSGFEKETTNNRMELMAVIEALKALPKSAVLTIKTDSSYVKNGITNWINNWIKNNWMSSAKTPVKNKDLWLILHAFIEGRKITWEWVKGHGDCQYNNDADCLAKSAIVTSFMEKSNELHE
ncbi:ribonuclease H [Alphaproteobacteria bacterium]|nr:ribonuclease H [Alphaproteobacteria bacterium]